MNPASLFTRVMQQQQSEKRKQSIIQAQQQQLQQQQQSFASPSSSISYTASSFSSSSSSSNNANPDISEEMAPFHSFLLDMQQIQSSSSFREEQLFKFFTQLRHSSPAAQLQALDLLSSLIAEKPSILLGCSNLLSLILRILQSSQVRFDHEVSDAGTAIYCKLFWLISSTATEHLNVKDLKRLFRILRRVVEKKSPPVLCRLMLSSLADMAAGTSSSTSMYSFPNSSLNSSQPLPPPPSCCFDFSGTQSALALPPLEKFAASKGYTVCFWIRFEAHAPSANASASSSSAPNTARPLPMAQPVSQKGMAVAANVAAAHPAPNPNQLAYLYSFLTDKGRGIEGLIGKSSGNIVIRSCSRGVLQELNTEVKLVEKRWYFLAIVHKKPQTFSRSSGTVSLYLNEELSYEGELSYPQLPDPLVFNAFAAATHPSKPSSPFIGRLATISFHNRPLQLAQIQTLYRKGSDFCISVLNQIDRSGKFLNFVSNSISSLLGAISSVATTVAHTATSNLIPDKSDDTDTNAGEGADMGISAESKKQLESYKDIFKSLLCLYHPKCVENHLALDCSPLTGSSSSSIHQPCHASILPGVQICYHKNVRDIIHLAIGGITCFFPLFQHLDVLSGGSGLNSASAATNAGSIKKIGGRSGSMSAASSEPSPLRIRSQSSILPLVFRTLQLMLRDNAANQIQFLQVSGFQVVSYLLTKYASVYHLSEGLLPALEEMMREFSYGFGLAKLLAIQSAEDSSQSGVLLDAASGAASSGSKYDSTNHQLPVSRAAEKTLFNDFFLHVLFNFSLWFRTPITSPASTATAVGSDERTSYQTASAALDDLSQHQVPFAVQFEVLMLIKSHVLKNPRYFRRLLSAGGGSGVPLNSSNINNPTHVHAGGASVGPVKFILDSLRRFINYQSIVEQYATVSTLLSPPRPASPLAVQTLSPFFHPFLSGEVSQTVRNFRSMRKEWYTILQSMMLCSVSAQPLNELGGPVNSNANVVREADMLSLIQIISEVSEASASSATTTAVDSSLGNNPIPTAPNATNAHSWVLAEYLEFLTTLLRVRPTEVTPMLQRNGGLLLFTSILSRNVKYQHVQVAVIHLISSFFNNMMQDRVSYTLEQVHTQVTTVLANLQVTLSEVYFTVPTYEALLELSCGLDAGSLGAANAAEDAIERFCMSLDRSSADGHDERSTAGNDGHISPINFAPSGSPPSYNSNTTSPAPHSPSSVNHSIFTGPSPPSRAAALSENCTVQFPRVFELIHSLLLNNDVLRTKDRRKMHENWNTESRKKAISRVSMESESMPVISSSSDAQRAASPMSPQPASGASTHRSSDNIHWDAEADANVAAAFTIHPPVAPFSLFHPSFNPVLGSHLSTLVAPLVSLAKFLSDLDLLLRNSPTNSQLLLSKWSMGLSLCFRELDWQGGVPIEEQLNLAGRKQESKEDREKNAPTTVANVPTRGRPSVTASAEEEKMIAAKLQAHRPSLSMADDIDSFLRADEGHSQQRHHQSIDEEIASTSPLSSAATARATNSSSPPFSAPANDAYLQALFRQQLLADIDLALPVGSSSPVPLLASKIAETMLYHALVHVRDGWIHWRDALLLLRFEAEAKQDEAEVQREEMERRGERLIITEERFRAVRRNLLIALFRRLELLPQASLSASVASGATGVASNNLTLHLNLTHTIDLVEEMLYLDNSQRFKNLRFRMVDADEDGAAESSSGNNPARKGSRLESVTRSLSTSTSGAGGESWVLMDEEENDVVSSNNSASSSDPFAAMTPTQAIFFRQEWGLIRELLQCLVHLRFSLQPSRVNATGTSMSLMTSAFALNETGNTVVIDSSGSPDPLNAGGSSLSISSSPSSSTNTSRTGGPLRVIVRLLLDCCSAICLSTQLKQRNAKNQPEDLRAATSGSAETGLSELQDVVSSLGALVHVELDVSTFVNAQGHYTEKGASREWKNRSVLHILWKLCNIIQVLPKFTNGSGALTLPEQMRKILLSTANQIVESLKPFAAVPFTLFDPSAATQPNSTSSPYASNDRSVYVPLVVNEEGALDIDPTFQLPILTKMAAPRPASGSISNSLVPPISPTSSAAGSGRSSPAIPTSATDAAGLAAASSPLYSRILRACQEYVNSSAQLFHSLAVRFANDQQSESARVERLLRQRFKERDSGFGASTSNRDAARASWRSVQTFSYSEANRRAVADSFYGDHIARNAEQWRNLAHDLYSEGSAWCSSELASRRKFYRIDAVEDGYRMRRKIRVFLDAADHHQASQSYIEHARTIAMLKEKEKKQKELAAKKREDRLSGGGSNSANNPVTPTVKRLNAPAQSSLHTSTSSPSLSATASAAKEAAASTNPERATSPGSPGADVAASEIDSLSLADQNTSMPSAIESAATEERAEIEQLEKLNELGKSLGGLKSAIDEEEDAEADAQDEETKDDADEERKDGDLPTGGKRRQKRGSFEDEEAAANEEEDRLTSLPRSRKSGESLTALDDRKLSHVNGEDKQKKASEANQDEAVDWDMCEVPNANSPGVGGSSGAAPSLSVPSFNPASIYTSPFVTLVLPMI